MTQDTASQAEAREHIPDALLDHTDPGDCEEAVARMCRRHTDERTVVPTEKLVAFYDDIQRIFETCEDEGDRVYLASTNDRERLGEIARDAQALAFSARSADDARTIEILRRALAWHGEPARMAATREEWQQEIDAAIAWVKENPEEGRPSFPTWANAAPRPAVSREAVAKLIDPETHKWLDHYRQNSGPWLAIHEKWSNALAKADAILQLLQGKGGER